MAVKTDVPTAMPQSPVIQNQVPANPGTAQAIKLLGGIGIQAGVDKLKGDLRQELTANEEAFRSELLAEVQSFENPDLGEVLNIDDEAISNLPESHPVRKMITLQAKNQLANEQGVITDDQLAIRQEKTLRQFMARFPNLSSEFLGVARNFGGFGVVPMDLQATSDALEKIGAAQSEQFEQLVQVSKELDVPQYLLHSDPVQYWSRTIEAMNMQDDVSRTTRQAERLNAVGQLDEVKYRGLMREAMPGLIDTASGNIRSVVLGNTGIDNLTQLGDKIASGEVSMQEVRDRLIVEKAQYLANLRGSFPGTVGDDVFNAAAAPLAQIYDEAIAANSPEAIANVLTSYKNIYRDSAILSIPGGPQMEWTFSQVAKLAEANILPAEVDKQMLGRMYQRMLLGSMPGTVMHGVSTPNGIVGTWRQQIDAATQDPAQTNQVLAATYKNIRDVISDPTLPGTQEAKDFVANMLVDFSNDYNQRFNDPVNPVIPPPEVTSEALSITAHSNTIEVMDTMTRDQRVAFQKDMGTVVRHQLDHILKVEVPTLLQNELEQNFSTKEAPAPVASVNPMAGGSVALMAFLQGDDPERTAGFGDVIRVNQSGGRVFFEVNPEQVELLRTPALAERVDRTVDGLNATFSRRLSDLVASTSHLNGTKDYEGTFQRMMARFPALAPDLQIRGQ